MRTKTFLLSAAVLAAGVSASMAQSVFSVNAVGYVNVSLVAGYNLIANPLNGTNNFLGTILPVVPDGASIQKWNPASQQFDAASERSYLDGVGWLPDGNVTLAPGEGFFVNLPPGPSVTVTFVGEVPQGPSLSVSIPANYSIISSIVPQAFSISDTATFGFPPADGDSYLTWNTTTQSFNEAFTYLDGVGWLATEPPPLPVGAGVFYNNTAAARTWTRAFNVN